MNLTNLDATTRKYMLQEVEHDERAGRLYISSRLSNRGGAEYPSLLKAAIAAADDGFLAAQLRGLGMLNSTEPRNTRNGTIWAKVPVNAPETLAEGEFNRYYARGVCARAMAEGITHVEVYRAKQVANPRSESEDMLGKLIDPSALLKDLRENIGTDTALGLPPGPNSGLSVRFPQG